VEYVDFEVLLQLERMRSGLLANISQEAGAPLTLPGGLTSTLFQPDMQLPPAEPGICLEAVEREIGRLSHFITGMQDAGSRNKFALKLEKSDCLFTDIVNAVLPRLELICRRHPLQIKSPGKLPVIYVDRDRIGQVLLNLVQNAVRYSKEGSPVKITTRCTAEKVITSVIDHGVGIPPGLRSVIFDRLSPLKNLKPENPEQTVSGLSLCRDIIEAHGGKIWVRSRVGQGSRFSFVLPVMH
jgi:K+-sensing histidine kinase KdpD